MKKKLVFLVIFIFLLFPSILSECDSDQIDINNASESELTKIDGVGSSTAKKIISKRPFNSLDGLKRVDGRGTSIEEGKLEKIKQQGLACVENSSENSGESEEENNSKNNDENDSTENLDYKFKEVNEDEDKKKDKKPIMRDVIKLSSPSDSAKESEKKNSSDPKTIKNPNSFNFQENKSKYANYGLLVVMVIVLSSMLTKYKKTNTKMSSENNIKAIMILEILGRPAEHLKKTLEDIINKIGNEKNVEVTNKKIHEPTQSKDNKNFFTTFAEVEINVKSISLLTSLMFKYMPANIEIIEPETIALTNNGWGDILSELIRKLHGYDEIARMLQNEKNILEKKLKELKGMDKTQSNSENNQSNPGS